MGAEHKTFPKGTYLFKEGDSSDCMYLIRSGSVSIRKLKNQGEVEIGKVYSDEVLGELSFFDRKPRSAAAVALTDVEVLVIDFKSLDSIYKKVPSYLKTIMSAVAERLRKADETIRSLEREYAENIPIKTKGKT